MLNFEEALVIAKKAIFEIQKKSNIKLMIFENKTIEFEYGWMFLYQSEEYIMTGNLDKLVGGNAPIIVDKYNKSYIITGTGHVKEYYINQYSKYRDDIDKLNEIFGNRVVC